MKKKSLKELKKKLIQNIINLLLKLKKDYYLKSGAKSKEIIAPLSQFHIKIPVLQIVAHLCKRNLLIKLYLNNFNKMLMIKYINLYHKTISINYYLYTMDLISQLFNHS